MMEDALDLPSFQKSYKTFYNFRAAPVRKKYEDEIIRTLSKMKEEELKNDKEKYTSEYSATVGVEWDKIPTSWKEKALSELIDKHPIEDQTISWWQWQNRGLKSGFKRNAHFTTPVEESVRDPPGEVRRLTAPMTAYEIYNHDFPKTTAPSWFHPIPRTDGVIRILRDLK